MGQVEGLEGKRREQWTVLVEEYAASGQSQRRFCRERGIGQSTLRYWRRRLELEIGAQGQRRAAGPGLIPVKVLADGPATGGGAEVVVIACSGVRIAVGRDFDAGTLRRVLAVVEAAS